MFLVLHARLSSLLKSIGEQTWEVGTKSVRLALAERITKHVLSQDLEVAASSSAKPMYVQWG